MVFKPLTPDRTQRLTIPLKDMVVLSGDINVRKRGKNARVSIAGRVFDIYGISCGLPGCICDSLLKEVI